MTLQFEEHVVRTVVGTRGEPWFGAADVLMALDRKAMERTVWMKRKRV